MTVQDIKLSFPRPNEVRVFVVQPQWEDRDWAVHEGLYFHSHRRQLTDWIQGALEAASRERAALVLFPELSVPEELVPLFKNWCAKESAVAVAGSHYVKRGDRHVAVCPVVIADTEYLVEKRTPSPFERSPLPGHGLRSGERLCVFRESPIGNFSVLICSDYLDDAVKRDVLQFSIDLLCVPSFQNDSNEYHPRMNIDCKDKREGLYILYGNNVLRTSDSRVLGDGRSAVFGVMDRQFLEPLKAARYTDGALECKAIEIPHGKDYMIIELNLQEKRPLLGRSVHSAPNINVREIGVLHALAAGLATEHLQVSKDRGSNSLAQLRVNEELRKRVDTPQALLDAYKEHQQLRNAYKRSHETLARVVQELYPPIEGPRHHFESIKSRYVIYPNGDCEVTETLVIIPCSERPIHLWHTNIWADPESAEMPFIDDIRLEIVDLGENTAVTYLPTLDEGREKTLCVFFLPEIKSDEKRKIRLKYRWPGFVRHLVNGDEVWFAWAYKTRLGRLLATLKIFYNEISRL
jgi:predicted amidohydrolase